MLSRFVAFGALVFAMTVADVAHGDFVDRGTVSVANAIGKSRPGLAKESRKSLAKIVIATSKEHNIDPFTIVAIVHKRKPLEPGGCERRWRRLWTWPSARALYRRLPSGHPCRA